jgi:hypothetical protein
VGVVLVAFSTFGCAGRVGDPASAGSAGTAPVSANAVSGDASACPQTPFDLEVREGAAPDTRTRTIHITNAYVLRLDRGADWMIVAGDFLMNPEALRSTFPKIPKGKTLLVIDLLAQGLQAGDSPPLPRAGNKAKVVVDPMAAKGSWRMTLRLEPVVDGSDDVVAPRGGATITATDPTRLGADLDMTSTSGWQVNGALAAKVIEGDADHFDPCRPTCRPPDSVERAKHS